jgi:predicted transcriptional regulator
MANIIKANIQFKDTNIDRVFFSLSHKIRREVIELLTFKEYEVRELFKLFDISKPALVKHLGILEDAGLIQRIKEKRQSLCKLRSEHLKSLKEYFDFYEMFWTKK